MMQALHNIFHKRWVYCFSAVVDITLVVKKMPELLSFFKEHVYSFPGLKRLLIKKQANKKKVVW